MDSCHVLWKLLTSAQRSWPWVLLGLVTGRRSWMLPWRPLLESVVIITHGVYSHSSVGQSLYHPSWFGPTLVLAVCYFNWSPVFTFTPNEWVFMYRKETHKFMNTKKRKQKTNVSFLNILPTSLHPVGEKVRIPEPTRSSCTLGRVLSSPRKRLGTMTAACRFSQIWVPLCLKREGEMA